MIPSMTTTDKTSWQRATEIIPGRTYSWNSDGCYPWVARMVDREGDALAVTYLDTKGYLCAGEVNEEWPYEPAPCPPWIVRTEYRAPEHGEWYVADSGDTMMYSYTPVDGEVGPDRVYCPKDSRVVIIIEPNPEYRS